MSEPSAHPPHTTAVVLKGYPRLSETFIAQELAGLEEAGHNLILFSMRHHTETKRHPIHDEIQAPVVYLPEYLRQEPWRLVKALARTVWQPQFWRATATWIKDICRDPTPNRFRRFGQAIVLAAELPERVTRLYAHFIHTPATVTRYASLITNKPWTCSAHAKDIWTSSDWDLQTSLSSAEWVVTCTAFGHRHLQTLAANPKRVHLVYHGLDLDRFPEFTGQHTYRDGQNPSQPVRLLSVGRAVDKKGFDTLLEALAKLPDNLAWSWSHIGGGGRLKELRTLAEERGLTDRITWYGARDQAEVLQHYREADVFVLPCRVTADGDRDGLPNVLVEAQSQGLACISTPVSGVPELIIDQENGLLVPPDDPATLATAIIRLSRAPQIRAEMGKAGQIKVRTTFDFRSGLRTLDDLFDTPQFGTPQSETLKNTTAPVDRTGQNPAEPLPSAKSVQS